ncbi:MAG: peptidoglycan-binding protein [Verrucomicrobiota bacterium]|nr:peptidoglycan-binding protein [Verrucomicrobiota bacterium]
MKAWLPLGISFLLLQSALADDGLREAQGSLKSQGFYYGEVSGETNPATTAAIRRFQIRNGLQVTGELNNETASVLKLSHAPAPSVAPATQPTPSRQMAARPLPSPTPAVATNSGVFDNTPYAQAPADAQRRVIVDAQGLLRERGLYRAEIDGVYGPSLEFSLRAYQSQAGLEPSGRLDLETLSALGLLPGARVARPRRHPEPTPFRRVVRGEWIH